MDYIGLGSRLGAYSLNGVVGKGGCGYVFRVSSDMVSANRENAGPAELALKIASPRVDATAFPGPHTGPSTHYLFDTLGVFANTGTTDCGPLGWEQAADVLQAEYELLRQLRNGTFPAVFDFARNADVCYYVMEYIPGWDLRGILKRERPALWRQRIPKLREVLVTLIGVRDQHSGFYHGDIKPENILLAADDRVRLIDPALRVEGPPVGGVLTMTLTAPYNPLALSGSAADTFALAAIVAELLLQMPAFANVTEPILGREAKQIPQRNWLGRKRAALDTHLHLNEIERALPREAGKTLIQWFVDPPSYEEMLCAWTALESDVC